MLNSVYLTTVKYGQINLQILFKWVFKIWWEKSKKKNHLKTPKIVLGKNI